MTRTAPGTTTLGDLLQKCPGGLSALLAQHRHHGAIHRYIQRRLPSFLAEHCLACVARGESVIVYTDSPAWATQLRFALPGLLRGLQTNFDPGWKCTQIRILAPIHGPSPIEKQICVPGGSAILQVRAAAEDCSSSEVRASLLRLAATWQKRSR